MNLGDSIRKNTLWILTGNVFGRILAFVIGVFLARLLVPADFGMIVTIQIFTGVASYFAGGGMGEALIRAKHVKDTDYKVVFTLQMMICTLIYFCFYSIAPYFAIWFNDPLYQDLIRVSTLNFLFRPFVRIPSSKLKREMRFKQISIIGFISSLASGSVSIYLAYESFGVWSLVFGGLTGTFVNLLGLIAITRWIPGIYFESAAAKRLGSYGFKSSINSIIDYIRKQSSNLIISRMLGPSMLGFYNKADSLSELPMQMIGGNAYQTVFRGLAKIQDNLDQSRYVFYRTILLVSVYTFPFYVGLYWVAEPFILNIYGEKWVQAIIPLKILCITGFFRCISNSSGAVIAAQNRIGTEIGIQFETWMILVIGCLLGIEWGIEGVAWGVLPSFLYRSVRLVFLANECIDGRFIYVLKALLPSLYLNTMLAIICFYSDYGLSEFEITEKSAKYLFLMAGIGSLCYMMSFLFIPILPLQTEVKRYKTLFFNSLFGFFIKMDK